jgi:putative Mn2+ efflux pump MntP
MQPSELVGSLLVASGLAVDSCLVALAYGVSAGGSRLGGALRIGAIFGLFQGGMLALGWLVGAPVASLLHRYDHWIAFSVLTVIGVRTIRESGEDGAQGKDASSLARLALAGIATSIDALAVGFGMSLAEEPLSAPIVCTLAITALGSAACFASGRAIGARAERAAHWIAGLVLIGLGLRILLSHLLASEPGN